MKRERVVRLKFEDLSAGSGYLLSDRLALTARHVVEPCREGASCEISPLHASPSDGKALWLSKDHDLALIEADSPGWPQLASAPAGYGKVPETPLRPCVATGFPVAVGQSDHTVTATLSRVALPPSLSVGVDPPYPNEPEWWKGFSGAAIFYGERPLGVVGQSSLNFKGLLTATPIEFLFADESFQRIWRSRGLEPLSEFESSGRALTVLDEIASHIFWLDREEQAKDVINHLRGLQVGKQVLPQVIAVPGVDDDLHDYFMTKLARDADVQRFLRNRAARPADVIRLLSWPNIDGPIEANKEFPRVVSTLYRSLELPEPAENEPFEPDAEALRVALDRPGASRAFMVHVRQAIALGGYTELLRLLVELWGNLGPGEPALLFLCLALDEPKTPVSKPSLLGRFAKKTPIVTPENLMSAFEDHPAMRENAASVAWKPLDDLREIGTDHLGPWMKILQRECRSVPAAHLDGLILGLRARLSCKKRLRQVSDDVAYLLRLV